MPIRKDGKKTLHKGDAKRRKVALLRANEHDTKAIAAQVGLKERRVQAILAEPATQAMVEHFRLSVERQRLEAESALVGVLVEKLESPEWQEAADRLEKRLASREKVEIARLTPPPGMAGSAADVAPGEVRIEEFFQVVRGARVTTSGGDIN